MKDSSRIVSGRVSSQSTVIAFCRSPSWLIVCQNCGAPSAYLPASSFTPTPTPASAPPEVASTPSVHATAAISCLISPSRVNRSTATRALP